MYAVLTLESISTDTPKSEYLFVMDTKCPLSGDSTLCSYTVYAKLQYNNTYVCNVLVLLCDYR